MQTLTEKVVIKIDGDEYKAYNFLNISLSQELLRPNEFRFTMQKKSLQDCMKDSDFPLPKKLMGAEVTCKIETRRFSQKDILEDKTEALEFKGIIFNVEVYRSSDMFSEQLIDIIAYSPDYLLIDHPHCFSYENDALKKIVTATLDPHKIPNAINPRTTDPVPYTVQYNESNHQFLIRLAKRYGEWMYYDGTKWIFGEIKKKDAVKLDSRNDIQNYRYYAGLKHHTLKHAHHDYLKYENPSKSNADFSDLTTTGFHPLTDEAKTKSEKWFKKETFQHLRCSNPEGDGVKPGNPIDEPEVSAKAQMFGEKTQQVVCTGSSTRSDLTIGSVIKIIDHFYDDDKTHKDIPHDDLMIIGIVHTTQANGHYSNRFTAVPAKSEYPPYHQSDIFPVSSSQRARVMDNKDPEKLGRIRVQFLWQEEQDKNLMTPWIRIAQPHAGSNKGFYFIPEIDEEVMIDFENGNAEKPYVSGTVYNGEECPDSGRWYGDLNEIKAIRTRNGHTIEIHDEGDGGYIRIYDNMKENYILTFSTDDQLVKLESTGNIELYAKKNIIIGAGGNITMSAGNNMDTYVINEDFKYVGSNQTVWVDDNKEEHIAEKYQLTAKHIREEGTELIELYGCEIEIRSNESLKCDGGRLLDLYASNIRIN